MLPPLPAGGDQAPSWEQLRRLGAGFWLRDAGLLAGLAERLAKQQFAARRNADDCALLYCALGKRSVLQVGGASRRGRAGGTGMTGVVLPHLRQPSCLPPPPQLPLC